MYVYYTPIGSSVAESHKPHVIVGKIYIDSAGM